MTDVHASLTGELIQRQQTEEPSAPAKSVSGVTSILG
jgi:hypothetical protein